VSYLDRATDILARIREQGLYRSVATHQVDAPVDFSSNDYLGLARDPQVVAALRNATRAGSGGARLLGGRHREHSLLEEELAAWLGRERALLFSSGYHAALGAIPVLAQTVDAIASDQRNHASLIDGVRLAHVSRAIYPHGLPPPRNGSRLLVSESIFSMDGDSVDPRFLLESLGGDDVMLVDEAHALGVVGLQGAGLCVGLDDPRAVIMGTLSKSLGVFGGFVAGPERVVELLVNRARTFVFDTALPPALALAARIALMLVRRGDERRARLHANVARLRDGLRALGFPVLETPSPVVPVVLGTEERAMSVAAALLERGIYAPAIRPPTVPPGSARLRLSVRADHPAEHIERILRELRTCIVTS
jgi:8-amino-7-oxononanoate synthase